MKIIKFDWDCEEEIDWDCNREQYDREISNMETGNVFASIAVLTLIGFIIWKIFS